jgi:hypothetical protein
MNREDNTTDLIDLGAASERTEGAAIGIFDNEGTLYWPTGLSDD